MPEVYGGFGGVSKKAQKIYVGVNGVSKAVQKMYVGVNGAAVLVYPSAIPSTYISTSRFIVDQTATSFSIVRG